MPGVQELLASLIGGAGGGPGGPSPGMGPGGPGGGMPMPPGPPPGGAPPGPPGSTLPEIPTGGAEELVSQVQSIGTQLSHIAARMMSSGQSDAGIACAKAVKALEKVPELVQANQQSNPPPNMGAPGGGNFPPMGPGTMPAMLPGM